jgi:glycosyltransferase involved in cell wall biosynthesis
LNVLEPPVSRPAELAAAYAWADVVVLLSRYEGLPLTILEAQRAGAFVIATDVGAVSEVVQNSGTGVLIDDEAAVLECLDVLTRLSEHPEQARNAHLRTDGDPAWTLDWKTLVHPIVSALHR